MRGLNMRDSLRTEESKTPMKSKRPALTWVTVKTVGYYVACVFPIICLIVAFVWKRPAPKPNVSGTVEVSESATNSTEKRYSEEEYRQELAKTLDALQAYSDRNREQRAMDLAKINDALYNQLAETDKAWQEHATVALDALLSDGKESEYTAFNEAVVKRGKMLEDFKNTTFREWHDLEGRVATYERTLNQDVQTLGKNVAEALTEDSEVCIRRILSGPSLAFLITFEKPWRVYVNQEFTKTGRGDMDTGAVALEIHGRVIIGYDMTQVRLFTIEGEGKEIAGYRVKLPKPEIKDVILDYGKTDIVQMGITVAMLNRISRIGSQTLYRELFSRTKEFKERFLRDFQANQIYDEDFSQSNIKKTLEPYFKLQGNTVIIETTPTTFEEMMRVYLEPKAKMSAPSLRNVENR